MRRLFLGLWLGAAVLAPTLALHAQDKQSAPKRLTASDVKQMLDKKEKFFFLDVREPRELEQYGTLQGYVNIPVSQLEARLKEIPKDARIVTACQRGVRAGRAAEILQKAGYSVAGVCGMLGWKDEGVPLIYPKAANP
jgi:rhodanese-related sulfurtransferase